MDFLPRINRERGVALIQALLLAALLSLFGISATLQSREQLKLTSALEDRLASDLRNYSLLNEVIFNLLTVNNTAPTLQPFWSLESEVMGSRQQIRLADGLTLEVSNFAERLPVTYPQHPLWRPVLSAIGMSNDEIEEFLNELSVKQGFGNTSASGMKITESTESVYGQKMQLQGDFESWMPHWVERYPALTGIVHHYLMLEVQPRQLSKTLRAAGVSQNIAVGLQASLVGESSDGLILNRPSPLWRLESKQAFLGGYRVVTTDFVLTSLSAKPFDIVGRY